MSKPVPDKPLRKRSEVKAAQAAAVPPQPTPHDAGAALRDELAKPPEPPPLFESAHGAPAQLSEAWASIVERTFVTDPVGTYDKLEKLLSIGEERGDYATVAKHLDEAEVNARLAHRLSMTAKAERERYELDAAVVTGTMYEAAERQLQAEKDQKVRNKAITDGDVRARAATLYPEQYGAHEKKLARVKRMEEDVGDLAEKWNSRCRSLQTLLATMRRG